MNKLLIVLSILMSASFYGYGQNKFTTTYKKNRNQTTDNFKYQFPPLKTQNTYTQTTKNSSSIAENALTGLQSKQFDGTKITKANYKAALLRWIEIEPSDKILKSANISLQAKALFAELKDMYQLNNIDTEIHWGKIIRDEQNNEHLLATQYYNGLMVYGGEARLHAYNGQIKVINGQIYPTPSINTQPTISDADAIHIVNTSHENIKKIKPEHVRWIGEEQVKAELLIYHMQNDHTKEHLAYKVTLHPNITEKWIYFVDAHTSRILHKYKDSCSFFHDTGELLKNHTGTNSGPQNATETDLSGKTVNMKVYEEGGIFYLLNVSERMFNPGLSKLPNEPVGGILTLNALNTSPQSDDFVIDHLRDNDNRWNLPNATSAHTNASTVYKYYETNFDRLSFDGNGSTIYSIINVNEDNGDEMDNAFWNGIAMFYGNGKQAFSKPLAAALDVAAHEFSHGVIQYEANLEYQNESGALNESFADIFGILADRDDWTLGEEVVNRNIFKTGALRSMSDPNNGGRSLNDIGWQPKSTNEQYKGREDNGGVHINSGIPNHAFYLFANNSSVGLGRAERIYYKALTEYLVSSSDFSELRLAIRQSILDIHGQNNAILSAFNAAFDAVGIGQREGEVSNGDPVVYESNLGEDFVVWFNENTNDINVRTIASELDAIISKRGMLNTPSVSDDGSVILFVGADQSIYAITIDWSRQGEIEEIVVNSSSDWRNAAISKDGTKIAAIQGNLNQGIFDNRILIADLVGQTSRWFELFNPTTAQGVKTGDILFADALEWDITGEFVMYDAQNEIISLFNDPISYWDIGFLRAWDNSSNSFGDGQIFKLFPSLPENLSIGNPTFAKNSPDIIAFDLLDERNSQETYSIIGVNLESGAQGLITNNSKLGFPDFSSKDDKVLFNATTQAGSDVIASINLKPDFINGSGTPSVFIRNATWGTWFNNGTRSLTTAVDDPILYDNTVVISPNPTKDYLEISMPDLNCKNCPFEIFNTQGQLIQSGQISSPKTKISSAQLHSGIHYIVVRHENGNYSKSFVKQ